MRKVRANTIARFFSNYLDNEVARFDKKSQRTLADESISEEEKQELRATLATLEATGSNRLEVLRRIGPKKLLEKVKNTLIVALNSDRETLKESQKKIAIKKILILQRNS